MVDKAVLGAHNVVNVNNNDDTMDADGPEVAVVAEEEEETHMTFNSSMMPLGNNTLSAIH